MPEYTVNPFIDRTTTYTAATGPALGSLATRFNSTTRLWEDWIFVQNNSVVGWVAGNVIGRNNASANYTCELVPANESPMRVAGVAQHVIAAGSYGWIMREGLGEVIAGAAGFTANQSVVVGVAAGVGVDRAANTDMAFAFAIDNAAVGVLGTCWISCLG